MEMVQLEKKWYLSSSSSLSWNASVFRCYGCCVCSTLLSTSQATAPPPSALAVFLLVVVPFSCLWFHCSRNSCVSFCSCLLLLYHHKIKRLHWFCNILYRLTVALERCIIIAHRSLQLLLLLSLHCPRHVGGFNVIRTIQPLTENIKETSPFFSHSPFILCLTFARPTHQQPRIHPHL